MNGIVREAFSVILYRARSNMWDVWIYSNMDRSLEVLNEKKEMNEWDIVEIKHTQINVTGYSVTEE